MHHILVVEDDTAICDLLKDVLEQAGFTVYAVEDTRAALTMLADHPVDLILLDWMLPGQSGMEWARRLKKDEAYAEIPIIMLTARSEEDDKVRSLDGGVDDYVTKPFSPREMVARVRAVLRRAGKLDVLGRLELGGIVLIPDQHRVTIADTPIAISPTEYRLLEFFLTHPDRVYSRTQLLDQVWGRHTFIEERTVDVHIRRLRKLLAEFNREDLIQTVRGFGYRFSVES